MAVDPNSKVYFWTPMLRKSDNKYPVFLQDFLNENNVSIGDFVWEIEMRDNWGYYMVHSTPKPDGDVVTEGFPVHNEEDDLWYQTWEVRDFTDEEKSQNLIMAKQQSRMLAYQNYSNDILKGVTLEGKVYSLEPRESANLRNTLALAESDSSVTVLLRASDYSYESLSAADAIIKINLILAEGGKVYQKLMTYLKEVYDATVITDVPEVPDTFLGE